MVEETIKYPDGSVYVGEVKDGKRHGRGTFTNPDGRKYEGEWKDGEYHGRGTMTLPDGEKYEGEWKDGKRNGRGTETWPDGEKYEGEFQNDKYHGKGVAIYPDGAKYEGEFQDGMAHGRGVITYSDGAVYEGQVKTETINKPREIIKKEIQFFRHGIGTLKIPSKQIEITGGWKYDERHGKIIIDNDPEKGRIYDEGVDITDDWNNNTYTGNNFDEIESHVKYDKCTWIDNS